MELSDTQFDYAKDVTIMCVDRMIISGRIIESTPTGFWVKSNDTPHTKDVLFVFRTQIVYIHGKQWTHVH